jgi:hypothetical protein
VLNVTPLRESNDRKAPERRAALVAVGHNLLSSTNNFFKVVGSDLLLTFYPEPR